MISGISSAFKWQKLVHFWSALKNVNGKDLSGAQDFRSAWKDSVSKLTFSRAIQKALVEENKRMAKEQAARLNHIDQEVYQNRPSDAYFSQFNTTSR